MSRPHPATRQAANKEILSILIRLVNAHPEQRFGQLLINLSLADDNLPFWNEESLTTEMRVREVVKANGW